MQRLLRWENAIQSASYKIMHAPDGLQVDADPVLQAGIIVQARKLMVAFLRMLFPEQNTRNLHVEQQGTGR